MYSGFSKYLHPLFLNQAYLSELFNWQVDISFINYEHFVAHKMLQCRMVYCSIYSILFVK